ncbi:MAG: hypothetical protein KGS45_07075 [Planctomycetes bacterium]|nr:hypothetical protein [Planctomycetota bacterium]
MRTRHLTISRAFFLLFALFCACGCSSQRTAPAPEPSSALVPASELRGLTVRWLSVSAEEGQRILLRALENAAVEAPGLSALDRRRWADQGLAVALLPAVKVRALESLLPITAVQANNSADLLTWSVLASGPSWSEDRSVSSPDGTTTLAPGRIRLLGRSWAATTLTDAGPRALTRLELTLQHLLDRQSLGSLSGPTESAKGALARGPAFARTAIGLDLPPDLCLVVFAESPGTNRQGMLRPETLDRPETAAANPEPPVATVPTLGDLLLTGYGPESQVRTRVVLLIMGRPAAAAARLDQ